LEKISSRRQRNFKSPCGRAGQIIGIVKNIHMGYKNNLRAEVDYLAKLTDWDCNTSMSVRIKSGRIRETMGIANGKWEEYNGNRPFEYSFFDQEIGRTYRKEKQVSPIFGYLAAVSIIIFCLGLLAWHYSSIISFFLLLTQKLRDIFHVFPDGQLLGAVFFTLPALCAVRGSFPLEPTIILGEIDLVNPPHFFWLFHSHSVPHRGIKGYLNFFRTVFQAIAASRAEGFAERLESLDE
jgi:hypothetical protein